MPITVAIGAGNKGTADYIMQDYKTQFNGFEEGLSKDEEGQEYSSKYFDNPREKMSADDIQHHVDEVIKSHLPSRQHDKVENEGEIIDGIINDSSDSANYATSNILDADWLATIRDIASGNFSKFAREAAIVSKRVESLQKIQSGAGAFTSKADIVKFLSAPTTSYQSVGSGGMVIRDARILEYLKTIAPQIKQLSAEKSANESQQNSGKSVSMQTIHKDIDKNLENNTDAQRMVCKLDNCADKNNSMVTEQDIKCVADSGEHRPENVAMVREAFDKAAKKSAEEAHEKEKNEVHFDMEKNVREEKIEHSVVNDESKNVDGKWIDSVSPTHDDTKGYVREVEYSMTNGQEKVYSGLNDRQKDFIEVTYAGDNVFITGGAGTGKSYTVNAYVDNFVPADATVLRMATTGKAAENIDGVTIHRGFSIPVGNGVDLDKEEPKPSDALLKADVIVIDECGMMDAKTMSYVAKSIQIAEQMSGIHKQVILSGDFLQLPPVSKDNKIEWGFASLGWKQMDMHPVVLTDVVRQADLTTATNLNQIRVGDSRSLDYFNKNCVDNKNVPEDSIKIVPRNADVEAENNKYLDRAKGQGAQIYTFSSAGTGTEERKTTTLQVWTGARVICTQNDKNLKYVNGAMGTVIKVDDRTETVTVKLDNGNTVDIRPQTTEIKDYKYDKLTDKVETVTVGTTTQLPIRLGYAITVHKSQGQTYDKVIVDPKSFTEGQLYVALSRCKTVEGMRLTQPIQREWVKANSEAVRFCKDAESYGNARTYHGVDRKTAEQIYPRTADGIPKLVSGIGCNPDTCKPDFQAVRDAFGKSGARKTLHLTISHGPEITDPQLVHAMAKEFVELCPKIKGHQAVIATHLDRPSHLHSHLSINTTSMDDGKKLQLAPKDLEAMKNLMDDIAKERGINPLVKGFDHNLTIVNQKEAETSLSRGQHAMRQNTKHAVAEQSVDALSKADITKFAIDYQAASRTAKSFSEFQQIMQNKGHWCQYMYEGKNSKMVHTVSKIGSECAEYYLDRGGSSKIIGDFCPKSRSGSYTKAMTDKQMEEAIQRQSGLKIDLSADTLRENINTNRIAAGMEQIKPAQKSITDIIDKCVNKADTMEEFRQLMKREGININESICDIRYDNTDWNKASYETAVTKTEQQEIYQVEYTQRYDYVTADGRYGITDMDISKNELYTINGHQHESLYTPDAIRNRIEDRIKNSCARGEMSATTAKYKIDNLHKEEVASKRDHLTEVVIRKLYVQGKIGRIEATKLSKEVHKQLARNSMTYGKEWAKGENYLFISRKRFADDRIVGYGKNLEKTPVAKTAEAQKNQTKAHNHSKSANQERGKSFINHSKDTSKSY